MNPTIHTCTTPYGSYELRLVEANDQRVALLRDETNPHAAIYAAKSYDVTRIVEIVAAESLHRLLQPPALLAPHDLIDLTLNRAATFFVNKGYGFLGQQHVFCSELRAAYLQAFRHSSVRSFGRGTLAVVDDLRTNFDKRWHAHLRTQFAAPAAYLAKELEICYAPVCVLGDRDEIDSMIQRAIERLPRVRNCPCATAMQATRERGLIGDDWRTWINE